MTGTEDLLRRSLHERAERTTYEPTLVADVATRARFLQRRRTRTTALAAAAVVAAAVIPLGIVLADGPDSSLEPAGPANPRVVRVEPLSDLTQGAPPAIDHVDDSTYVFASGERVELPVDDGGVLDAAPFRGGILVAGAGPRLNSEAPTSPKLMLMDRDGTPRWTRCGSDVIEVSANRSVTAFGWSLDCARWSTPRIEWGPTTGDGQEGSRRIGAGQQIEPIGVTAERVVVNVADPATGGPMHVEVAEELGRPRVVPGLARAMDWAPTQGLVAGCPAAGPCAVVDESEGSPLITFADREVPLSFSPDGRLIATLREDDAGLPSLTVRDVETGDTVLTLLGTADTFQGDATSTAWEDSTHLLVARVDADGEALVRFGTDGSVELATPLQQPTLGGYLLPGS